MLIGKIELLWVIIKEIKRSRALLNPVRHQKEWILTWYKATEYSKRGEANAHKSSNASIA